MWRPRPLQMVFRNYIELIDEHADKELAAGFYRSLGYIKAAIDFNREIPEHQRDEIFEVYTAIMDLDHWHSPAGNNA